MAEKGGSKTPKTKAQEREDRLKAALKANMGRRKAQARARQAQNDAAGADPATNEESS